MSIEDVLGIDGVVSEVIDEREKVVIRRIISMPAPFAWQE
jgi:hypothetical protein